MTTSRSGWRGHWLAPSSSPRPVWLVAYVFTALVCMVLFGWARANNWMQSRHHPWVVAQYEQPWVGLAFGAVLVTAFVFSWRCARGRGSAAASLGALLGAVLLTVELSSAVSYDPIAGVLEVGTLGVPRTRLEFLATSEGVCSGARFESDGRWHFIPGSFRPRLLPLPQNTELLREMLMDAQRMIVESTPQSCPRAPQ